MGTLQALSLIILLMSFMVHQEIETAKIMKARKEWINEATTRFFWAFFIGAGLLLFSTLL